jgi:hypothetical protein
VTLRKGEALFLLWSFRIPMCFFQYWKMEIGNCELFPLRSCMTSLIKDGKALTSYFDKFAVVLDLFFRLHGYF